VIPFTLPIGYTEFVWFSQQHTFWDPFVAHIDISASCCLFRKLVSQLISTMSSMCLNPSEFYFPVLQLHFYHILNFSMWYVWFSQFSSDSNIILLSVDTKTVLLLVSKCCIFSSAFSIASCSAWLFKHHLSNLYFFLSVMLLSVNMAIIDPPPCSFLLPSVYTRGVQ
jgi:hypothetical protein